MSLILLFACDQHRVKAQEDFLKDRNVIDGLSFVAPPKPFPKNPMPAINDIGADWIAVIPFAYTRQKEAKVHYNTSDWQWWGERPEGCEETIKKAKEANLKIMLKPQVYIPGSWPGGLAFPNDEEWQAWEKSYEDYILFFAKMAEEQAVEIFCIGTEFKISAIQRPAYWEQLIQKIRNVYTGKITYAANWDEYDQISFWPQLDYIGVDAYFPLVDSPTPSIKQLSKAWAKPKKALKDFAIAMERPILFTEFGYLSVDGCTYNNWELEGKIKRLEVNEQAQANALEALFSEFWEEPFWHGGFIWKWFPNGAGHEGYIDKDYTPQNKMAEAIVQKWYKK